MILTDEEREAFRQQAAAQHMSLSSWLRQAGLKQLEDQRQHPIRTGADLRGFFASAPEDDGPEPDWEAHLQVIEESRRQGLATT